MCFKYLSLCVSQESHEHYLLKMPEVSEVSEVCILAGADKLGLMGKVLLENY